MHAWKYEEAEKRICNNRKSTESAKKENDREEKGNEKRLTRKK